MSIINLRQTAAIRGDEINLDRPLTNAEIDANFLNLNNSKLEDDGSISISNLKIKDASSPSNTILLTYSGTTLTIGDGTTTVSIPGTFDPGDISEQLTVQSKDVILGSADPYDPYIGDEAITDMATATGGGLRLGNYDPSVGFVNFIYDNAVSGFRAFAGGNVQDIFFIANDFKLADDLSKTLVELYADVDNINALLGTNGGTLDVDYATNNSITDNTSLKAAIEALDAEDIPTIRSDVDSNIATLATVNAALLFNISNVQAKTSTFVAVSTYLYRVTPNASSTVQVTLPSSNRGKVAIRLEDDTSNRKIQVVGTAGGTIENLSASDAVTISTALDTVEFIWDAASSVWRII